MSTPNLAPRYDEGYTLVSILPFPIAEPIVGVYPPTYRLEESKDGTPKVCHVPAGVHQYLPFGPEMEQRKIPLEPKEVAEAIVNNYHGTIVFTGPGAQPGFFCVPGIWNSEEISEKFPNALSTARRQQDNWCRELVREGDNQWSQYHRHTAISDLSRWALNYLHIERAWAEIPATEDMLQCPFCTTYIPIQSVVCMNCHQVVDRERYTQMTSGEPIKVQQDDTVEVAPPFAI